MRTWSKAGFGARGAEGRGYARPVLQRLASRHPLPELTAAPFRVLARHVFPSGSYCSLDFPLPEYGRFFCCCCFISYSTSIAVSRAGPLPPPPVPHSVVQQSACHPTAAPWAFGSGLVQGEQERRGYPSVGFVGETRRGLDFKSWQTKERQLRCMCGVRGGGELLWVWGAGTQHRAPAVVLHPCPSLSLCCALL